MAKNQVVEGTWEEIALHEGEFAASGKRLKVIILPEEPQSEVSSKEDPTLALFAQWDREDALMTPEEKAENDRIYAEIEKNGIPRVQL